MTGFGGNLQLAIDFDGVVHSYEKGWQDGRIYGTVVPGFWEWAIEAAARFDLIIHTSRAKTPAQQREVIDWLATQFELWLEETDQTARKMPTIVVQADKPPAWLTIDDRAVRFDGDWSAPELSVKALLGFRPWNKRD